MYGLVENYAEFILIAFTLMRRAVQHSINVRCSSIQYPGSTQIYILYQTSLLPFWLAYDRNQNVRNIHFKLGLRWNPTNSHEPSKSWDFISQVQYNLSCAWIFAIILNIYLYWFWLLDAGVFLKLLYDLNSFFHCCQLN